MKKIEILSPVGNKEMLYAAINNGADAIYMSGKDYGARKFATNFNKEELKEAVEYARLYGVKVYITINTLIYENEIEKFIEYVKFLYELNVDAVLVQDIGMINLIRNICPNLVIHASTQMHNHNIEGIKYLKELGVKRVVLARELSLEEIKNINVDIEKEVFVYGALCISYSGQCLMSSLLLNRSGNRGECAGMCRLPYELYEENKKINTEGPYLLSPKELNTLSHLREIIASGIDSLKIEGRMKSPEYVGYVTKIFRRLVDCYYNNEIMNVTPEELTNLKKLYNREFTLGHLFNERNYKLMNIKSPNHLGTFLGTATVEKNNKIKILLSDDIHQYDGIRFGNSEGMIVNYLYDKDFLLINKASKGDIVYVDNKIGLNQNENVLKTLDSKLLEKINDIPKRRVPVNIKVEALLNKPLKATISDFEHTITKSLGMVTASIKCPIKKEEIVERFSRLNETIFRLIDIEIIEDENIFIPVKIMNELRREIVLALELERKKRTIEPYYGNYPTNKISMNITKSINIFVHNEEQLKYLLNKEVNIYTDDLLMYKKYKQSNIYYVTDRVCAHLLDLENENIMCSNLSSIYKYNKNNNIFSDIYLNIVNSYSVETLASLNVKKISLTVENSLENIKDIINQYEKRNKSKPNLDILVYGRVELMVLKHCFLNMFINNDHDCKVCKNKKQYYLKDRNNFLFPIINKNCNSYILNYKNINLINNINYYKKIGINNFTINLFNESIEEIDKILNDINNNCRFVKQK